MLFKHLFEQEGFSRQLLYSLPGSVTGVIGGCYTAYVAVALPSFAGDPNAPFKMNEEQQSLIASIPSLGSIVGSLLTLTLVPRFGRKPILIAAQIPVLIAWGMIAWGLWYATFLGAMVITGFCVGITMPVGQLYLAEISTPQTRGFVTGSPMLWQVMYNLVNYVLGGFVRWKPLAITNGAILLFYFIMTILMPESPTWLLANGRKEEAKRSLEYLGRPVKEVDEVDPEPAKVTENRRESRAQLVEDEHAPSPPSFLKTLKWVNLKPVGALAIFVALRQFTGAFCVISYTVNIFESAGGALGPTASTATMGAVQVVCVMLSNCLTDKIGRKHLIIGSGLLMGLSHSIFGCYYYLKSHDSYRYLAEELNWIPLATLVLFMAGFCLGFATCMLVLMSELIPNEVKGWAPGFTVIVNSVSAFAVLKLYYNMKHGFTEAGLFFFYGAASLLAAIYCAVLLPETKGRNLDDEVSIEKGGVIPKIDLKKGFGDVK